MKIKLAILEKDVIYLKKIVSLFNSKYANDLEVYSFTEVETALTTIKNNRIDVLLASDVFSINFSDLPGKCSFAYFIDSADVDSIDGQKVICKFQRVDLIYKQIVSLFSEHGLHVKESITHHGEAKTICFAPVSGGTGASTLAVSASKYLAKRGSRVLYFSLELFSNSDLYFQGEGSEGFSDIIYALKSKKANWALKLKSVVKTDESGVSFFSPANTELDFRELTFDDKRDLINEVVHCGDYDYIIIDSSFSIDELQLVLYNSFSQLLLVCDGTPVSVDKLQRACLVLKIVSEQKEWDLYDNTRVIYNRFSSKTGVQAQVDTEVLGGIPVYAQATNKQIVDLLTDNEMFEKIK